MNHKNPGIQYNTWRRGSFNVQTSEQNAAWKRKYPDKIACHTYFEQSSLLLGIIPAVLWVDRIQKIKD